MAESDTATDLEELTAPVARIDAYMATWIDQRPLPDNLREAIRYALLGPGKRLRPILTIRCCEAVGGIEDAIRYALLGPGKRLRPILTIRCCEAVGGIEDAALAPAAAVEMIHAFSLVHDDLPAMDDDDLRRGRPTLHRHTSEAMAVLAGDALMGLAVELVLSRVEPPELATAVCSELIRGCNDMIAGQVHDTLPGFDESIGPLERLQTIHRNKTGALIRAACRAGALCGGASKLQLEAITTYGEAVGLMFQVVDDLLDVTETTEQLGKTAGKDADQDKLTYPSVLGIEGSRSEAERLRLEALSALKTLGERAGTLRRLCEYLAVRNR